MRRRDCLRLGTLGLGVAGLAWTATTGPLTPAQAAEGRKLPPLKITDIKTILTAPAGIRLVVVKVMTDEPGLYGLGCATFTQRPRTVETAVERYLKPFLIGKNPLAVEDTYQAMFVSSYWRNGPV